MCQCQAPMDGATGAIARPCYASISSGFPTPGAESRVPAVPSCAPAVDRVDVEDAFGVLQEAPFALGMTKCVASGSVERLVR